MKIRNYIKRKFRNTSGETIAETLVTMIILSLAVLMIAGAVVTAAKVNKRADNMDTAFTTGEAAGNIGTDGPKVTISEKTEGTGKSVTVPVQVYETKKSGNKKYIYYEMFK